MPWIGAWPRSLRVTGEGRADPAVGSVGGALPKESLLDLIEQIKALDMEDVHRQLAEQQGSTN